MRRAVEPIASGSPALQEQLFLALHAGHSSTPITLVVARIHTSKAIHFEGYIR